ncbi:MAG: trigger factor [Gemmatimonadota bacterium]
MAIDTSSRKESDGVQVAVEVGDGWSRRLTITVAPERVTRARSKERERLAKSIRLKGFRKGKVPPSVVEQRFGSDLDAFVTERLIETAYREAVDQEELHPAGAASISNVQYAPGERLIFQAEVEIVPSVELARVGGFRLTRRVEPVTDEEVREILDRIRAEHAEWVPADRRPAEGDRVAVRVAPLGEGEAEPSAAAKAYHFLLGDRQALPDVEKAIATLATGESGTFLVEFPAEKEGAESERRRLHITLDGVEERALPELDDDLAAKATGGDRRTVTEMEEAIRADLARHHEAEAEGRLRGQLLEALMEANPFSLPGSLVDRYLDGMLRAPEDADREELRQAKESLRPHAERQIKEELILDRLIEREALEPGEDEVAAKVAEHAERRGLSPTALRRKLEKEDQLASLRRNLAVEKAFEYLKSRSEIE